MLSSVSIKQANTLLNKLEKKTRVKMYWKKKNMSVYYAQILKYIRNSHCAITYTKIN